LEGEVILSDILKRMGIEMPLTPTRPPALSDGVRLLLILLSRRHSGGNVVSVDETLLRNEWPSSCSETFEQAVESAVAKRLVAKMSIGYALTDLGKAAAH
jgi:hypothetical protein